MPPLIYTQLVVIRVSSQAPGVTSNSAAVLRDELRQILNLWLLEIPSHIRPTMEVLAVGSAEDFPCTEIPRC